LKEKNPLTFNKGGVMIFFSLFWALMPEMGANILIDSTYIDAEKGMKERLLIVEIVGTRGREEFGDIKVRYNKKHSRFEIFEAYTKLPDGRKVKPEKKAISDVSAPEVYNAPMYSNNIMKVVSFPEVGKGAIIHYHYRILSKKKKRKHISGTLLFGDKEDIKKKVLVISTYTNIISNIKPEIIKNNDKKLYVFERLNIKRIPKETFSPPKEELTDYLIYSTDTLWKNVGKNFWNAFKKGIKNFKKINRLNACISFVRDSVRNIHLSLGFVEAKPNSPKSIWKNRYGESRDKSALLISLLKGIGVESFPVLVSSNGIHIIKNIPTMDQFDRIIVAVQKKKGFRFIDPVSEYSRDNYIPEWGEQGLLIRADTAYFVNIENPDMAATNTVVKSELHIDREGGLIASVSEELYGKYSNSMRSLIKRKTQEEIKRYMKSVVNRIMTGTVLDSFSFSEFDTVPLIVKIDFHVKNFGEIQDNKMHISLIGDILGMSAHRFIISTEKRKIPLYLRHPYNYNEYIKIYIPSGADVVYSPIPYIAEDSLCKIEISSSEENGMTLIKKSIYIRKGKYDKEKYNEIREKILPAVNRREKEVYLRLQ